MRGHPRHVGALLVSRHGRERPQEKEQRQPRRIEQATEQAHQQEAGERCEQHARKEVPARHAGPQSRQGAPGGKNESDEPRHALLEKICTPMFSVCQAR